MYQLVRSVPALALLSLSLGLLLIDYKPGCAQVGGGGLNGGGGGLNGGFGGGLGGGINGFGGGAGLTGGGLTGGGGTGGGTSGGVFRPDRLLFAPSQLASSGYIGGPYAQMGGGFGGGGLGGGGFGGGLSGGFAVLGGGAAGISGGGFAALGGGGFAALGGGLGGVGGFAGGLTGFGGGLAARQPVIRDTEPCSDSVHPSPVEQPRLTCRQFRADWQFAPRPKLPRPS
jgi:hypothetical protein